LCSTHCIEITSVNSDYVFYGVMTDRNRE